MDIVTYDDKFLIDLLATERLDAVRNEDGSLSILAESGKTTPVCVQTRVGEFVEVMDGLGNQICEGGDGEPLHFVAGEKEMRLRRKKLPEPTLDAAALNEARKTVTRYLVSDAPDDLPGTLAGVIEWMQGKLAAIPEASRATATVTFDTTMQVGEPSPQIEIAYTELETDQEVIDRITTEQERAHIAKMERHAAFEKLKAEFASS